MSEVREVTDIRDDGHYKQHVVEYEPSTQNIIVSRLTQFVWIVTTIIGSLLTLRFILRMIGANPGNPFADFIYNLTWIFVAPFQTLITNPGAPDGGMVFEFTTLVALVVYIVIAAIIVMLLHLFRDTGGTKRVTKVRDY